MKKLLCMLTCVLIVFQAFSQDSINLITKPIVEEGKRLYKSEMASWYGTDLFLEKFKDREKIGGYFSYDDQGISKCIFFSREATAKVIGTIAFDSTYNTANAEVNLTHRNFTDVELAYHAMRSKAFEIIKQDSFFQNYKNMNLNLIPLINNNEKKVYVLTGPENSGVVVFGNDYLLTFDDSNNLISKKRLHQNIIPIEYGKKIEGVDKIEGTMHMHLKETGDYMTPTDICTLMLYEKFTKWGQHTVISAKYLSIWNCKTDQLLTLPREVVDKIEKDQSERHKKN